jgi:2-polyprenyl-6-methoxyphenol hydroxylase-like FAD-dependent oxidoreductase
MNLLDNKTVAIIGAGPGGLTLARLLQQKGIQVKVYERDIDKTARVQGATLDLHHASGLRAITAAGLLDAFKTHYRPGHDSYRITDKNGTIHYEESTSSTFGDATFRPEIDRGPLRDLLLDSLRHGTVTWNSHIVGIEDSKIILQDGQTATADLVIGADGANSKIRPYLTPIKPAYSGLTYIVGNIPDAAQHTPQIRALINDGMIMALDDSKGLFLSTRGDGSLDFYIGWKVETVTNIPDIKQWFQQEFAGWSPLWLELFTTRDITIRPLTGMPSGLTWTSQDKLTLLGDAAHVLPPNGDGVNFAMLDALNLAENLTNGKYTSITSAIAAYEEKMLERFERERIETYDMLNWTYAPNGRQKMIDMLSAS